MLSAFAMSLLLTHRAHTLTRSTGSLDLAPVISSVQGRYIRGEELEVVGYDW